jgi:hypothetical protein
MSGMNFFLLKRQQNRLTQTQYGQEVADIAAVIQSFVIIFLEL